MRQLKLLLAIVITAIGVACTYHVFESLVHGSIHLIWTQWLPSDQTRWLVVPLCLVISAAYFGSQHLLDRKAEGRVEHGLGAPPAPELSNYLKILFIGYLSLVAGASLGPEAVLVPACMCLGALCARKIIGKEEQLLRLVAMAGFIALFTAFFDSIFIGVLSLLLVLKQTKIKFKPVLLITSVVAACVSWITLSLIEAKPYVALPPYTWQLNLKDIAISGALIVAGVFVVAAMNSLHKVFANLKKQGEQLPWWAVSLFAAAGLSLLYLAGGPLVEFTGNQSIVPMFDQAKQLGVVGLSWILIVKILAISWSKASGYRGGMIFPTIFVASVVVAIVHQFAPGYNGIYGIIAVLIGGFIANSKTHILV